MFTLGLALTETWLLATACVLAGLSLAVVAGKARRDLVEGATIERRARLAEGLDGPDATAVITAALRGSPWVQTDLMVALSRRDPEALGFAVSGDADRLLERQALKSREAGARGRAVLLSALLRRSQAVSLGRVLLQDRVGDVRLAACSALGMARSPEAARILVGALDHPSIAAARIVEQLAAPWAAPTVAELLPRLEDTHARAGAIRAIGLSGDLTSGLALWKLLADEELEIRIAAVRALGELRDTDAAPLLRPLLRDGAWEVRAQAARALGALGHVAAVDDLADCVSDANWWVRSNAADALAGLGPAGYAALQRVAHGTDRYAAERARQALAPDDVTARVEAA